MEEIELKFTIPKNKIASLIKTLKRKNFIPKGRVYEKTVMYDNPQSLMKTTDGRMRLRISGKKCEFSYKKPITREGIKKELEYETEISNFDQAQKILEMMEFTPTTSYERYRTILKSKNNQIKITIDEFPFENFIEIEGKEGKIKKIAQELSFPIEENLTDSCDTLFQKWRKERGLGFKPNMQFSDYDK